MSDSVLDMHSDGKEICSIHVTGQPISFVSNGTVSVSLWNFGAVTPDTV
jgi:hypothetical protein